MKKLKSPRSAKKLYGSEGSVYQIPGARFEGGVLVPVALTACIPESAVRKFAAKKPFVVHVDDGTKKHLILYLGD